MAKSALFVDTNVVDNPKSFVYLFSNREDLVLLSKSYDLKIARAVYDELLRHKREEFEGQVRQLRQNRVVQLLGIDVSKAERFDFEKLKDGLDSSVPFEICEMEPADEFMIEFYPLALEHKAPFESNSDKGFKDACVVSAIRRYLREHEGCEPVHFVTADKRLRESFADNEMVVLHEKLAELAKSEYDKDRETKKTSAASVSAAHTQKTDVPIPSDALDAINAFCGSTSFYSTHRAVEALAPYAHVLDAEVKTRLLKAAVTNDQISWVLQDSDVKAFMDPIFTEAENQLSDEEYYRYVNAAGLPNNRLDDNGNVQFSNVERQVYQAFVDGLFGHIKSIDWESRFILDSDQILSSLTDLLASSTLDPTILTWDAVAGVFVTAGITADGSCAPSETVRSFRNLMDASSAKKRDTVLSAIRGRFEMVEISSDSLPF